jgi:hypothetical protein
VPIQWRTLSEILPRGSATRQDWNALRAEALKFKSVREIIKKQKTDGTWGGNILGTQPDKTLGIRGAGTVAQYRALLELGVGADQRPFQRANRTLFRILSKDPDPNLQFEFKKLSAKDEAFAKWSREFLREGAVAALTQGKRDEDPRVRGAAHRIASSISSFLRSDLSEDPFVKEGSKTVLHREAYPPTLFSVAMVAFMPAIQRERAGFLERLVHYVTQPPPDANYVVAIGESTLKPSVQLLGDPLVLEDNGKPVDIPLALHWIELLTRMGMLEASPSAVRALSHLLADCNDQGVWDPRNLRGFPKSPSGLADFAFPLEPDAKQMESRKSDVTFRLALIAKLAGWELEFT